MSAVECRDMSGELWNNFYRVYSEMNKSRNIKNDSFDDFKRRLIKDCEEWKSANQKIYAVFDKNNKAVTWFDLTAINNAALDFFDFCGQIPDDAVKCVFETALKYLNENNRDEIYIRDECISLNNSLIRNRAEIYDEPVISILKREGMDLNLIKDIAESGIPDDKLKLILFRKFPEELTDSFIIFNNEVFKDKELFHPKKKEHHVFTKENVRENIKLEEVENFPYYMYALLDGEKFAAYCSVYVRKNGKVISHIGRFGLTATGRNYRGKGLAKYLKAKMYLKILEDFPEFEYAESDTYPWNEYMYRINEEFGFKPFSHEIRFVLTKEFLSHSLQIS